MNPPEPWERQPGESNPAYRAFCAYRDMPLPRSPNEAYRVFTGRPEGERWRLSGRWSYWMAQWRWVERVSAWDDHVDAEHRAAEEAAARVDVEHRQLLRQQQREREMALGDTLLQRVEEMLRLPVIDVRMERDAATGQVIQHFHPAKWRLADAAALARVGIELRRMGLDMHTDSDRNDLAAILGRVLSRVAESPSLQPQELTEDEIARLPSANGVHSGSNSVVGGDT